MSDVGTIARNDFRSVRRSKLLWGVVAIYVALELIVLYPAGGAENTALTDTLIGATWLSTLVLPLVAITGSYLSIAGERESNTVRFLLSQPTSRRAVVLGKFLSRGATMGIALAIAAAVGTLVVVSLYPDPAGGKLAAFFGFSALLVGAFVSLSIAISAAVASRARAIGGTLAVYFVGVVLSVVPGASIVSVLRELGDAAGLGVDDATYQFLGAVLSPAVAYQHGLYGLYPEDVRLDALVDAPAYLRPPAMVLLMLAWIVVPLVVGSVVFDRAEIG